MAYVYQHIRNDTGNVFYIGIGSDKGGKYYRAYRKTGRNNYWNNITNKHGYRVEIVMDNLSWEEAISNERRLISIYGRKNLCNMTDGGEGTPGWKPTEEQRIEMSRIRKGKCYGGREKGFKTPEETRKKISESMKGNNRNKRNPVPDETRTKIKEALLGKPSPTRKKVMCIETGIIYNSCAEASELLGLPKSGVNKSASGFGKSTGGLHFRYV